MQDKQKIRLDDWERDPDCDNEFAVYADFKGYELQLYTEPCEDSIRTPYGIKCFNADIYVGYDEEGEWLGCIWAPVHLYIADDNLLYPSYVPDVDGADTGTYGGNDLEFEAKMAKWLTDPEFIKLINEMAEVLANEINKYRTKK